MTSSSSSKPPSSRRKCTTSVRIDGMTCASCELLLERKLRAVPGVLHADVHHRKGTAHITADADALPAYEQIAHAIRKAGYELRSEDEQVPSDPQHRLWMDIGGSLLVIAVMYLLLRKFDLVSLAPSTSDALSLSGIFIIGLIAGTSSCLAVTGGLLLALAAKHNELHRAETAWEKFRPLLHFNIGRLASYFFLGGLIGVIGQSITLSAKASGYMTILVACIMLALALNMLHIMPAGMFRVRLPKKWTHWIHNLSESDHPAAPFALGAFTFFLPCGFTQSLQLVALASGSFLAGAMTMFVFALGTLPSLLGVSAVSASTRGIWARMFLRFTGTLVLVLALFNLKSGMTLAGVDFSRLTNRVSVVEGSLPSVVDGIQTVSMKVTPAGYVPQDLTIKAGIPVRWMIDGAGATGCTSQIVIPDLRVTQSLTRGMNEVRFTAPTPGHLAFSCSMGMVRGSFTVL